MPSKGTGAREFTAPLNHVRWPHSKGDPEEMEVIRASYADTSSAPSSPSLVHRNFSSRDPTDEEREGINLCSLMEIGTSLAVENYFLDGRW